MGDDIGLREAEILGKPPRIAPLLADELDESARRTISELFAALGVRQTATIPPFFGIALKHPGLFHCQMATTIALPGRAGLPPRERELAILRVGWPCRAPFEWGEHVNIRKGLGITAEEVERVARGSAAPGWSVHDRAVIKGVEELLGDHYLSDATWTLLAGTWTELQLLEFPQLVGQYFSLALLQNTLRIPLRPGNSGLRHRQ